MKFVHGTSLLFLHCTKTKITFMGYRDDKKHNFFLTLTHKRTRYVCCLLPSLIDPSLTKTIGHIQCRGHRSTESIFTKTIGRIQCIGSVCYRLRQKEQKQGLPQGPHERSNSGWYDPCHSHVKTREVGSPR